MKLLQFVSGLRLVKFVRLLRAESASRQSTIEEIGWELCHYYLDIASSRKKTWTEVHRLHDDLTLFNPAPLT